jgi:uncharacterized membrane protein YeaQ/YmgE (transglycosylase-associated protein family)
MPVSIGIVGAIVGGFIFDVAGGVGVTGFNAWSFLVAIIGSIIVLAVLSRLHRTPRSLTCFRPVQEVQ